MAGPTTKQFWQAAKQIYNNPNSKDPAKVLVPPDGCTISDYRLDDDEFAAATFSHRQEPWSIVAFKGTTPNISFSFHNNAAFLTVAWQSALFGVVPVIAQSVHIKLDQTLVQDINLAVPGGGIPSYFTKGAQYLAGARRRAADSKLYLGGHSLGGAIAEYAANQAENQAIAGTCFAAPGSTVFKSSDGAIRSLVDENDLIGQFCLNHHVGRVQTLDQAGMALVNDIPYAALQNLITAELGIQAIWSNHMGSWENIIDIAAMLNVCGLIAMGMSIARYHMIDHYGMVLGLTGNAWHTRAIVLAICNAIKQLAAAAYHAGLQAVHAAAGALESAWAWLRHEVTVGFYDLLVGLKAICNALGQLVIKVDQGVLWLCWQSVSVPVRLL